MKKSLYIISLIFILVVGCQNVNTTVEMDSLNNLRYIADESSKVFMDSDKYLYFTVQTTLQNMSKQQVNFHIKYLFNDPILKREFGDKFVIGEEYNLKPENFKLDSNQKYSYNASLKIDKTNLSKLDLKNITNNITIVIFDDQGKELVIKD